jgi:hypothetical protein
VLLRLVLEYGADCVITTHAVMTMIIYTAFLPPKICDAILSVDDPRDAQIVSKSNDFALACKTLNSNIDDAPQWTAILSRCPSTFDEIPGGLGAEHLSSFSTSIRWRLAECVHRPWKGLVWARLRYCAGWNVP